MRGQGIEGDPPACDGIGKGSDIERMFGRLKDFRRIVTRYDFLATNYLAAAISYWL